MLADYIKGRFLAAFKQAPSLVVRSPGRINLMGEHTDYNHGFVLPAAIDKQIVCAFGGGVQGRCRLVAAGLDDAFECDIARIERSPKSWPNYVLGVVEQFRERGLEVGGFDCVVGGDIPIGAGLSSSAALECAVTQGLAALFGHRLEKLDVVRMAQGAENEFVGVQCGIMDQFASVQGKAGHVIRLDCRSLDFAYYPFPLRDYKIVLCDTGVKHDLASSEYNDRRKECEAGVAELKRHYSDVCSLRDVSIRQLDEHREEFDPVVYRRCRYVIGENERVLESCRMLERGDLPAFGANMYRTHEGLRDDYGVSCAELDFLVERARADGRAIGARMMGGGFGGCTVNLVMTAECDAFIEQMTNAYFSNLGLELKTYTVDIVDGTRTVTVQ